MSLAPSRAADSAIAHAMLCLFATPRIRPFLPSRSIPSFFSLSFFLLSAGTVSRAQSGTDFSLSVARIEGGRLKSVSLYARYSANREDNTALNYNHAIMIRPISTQTPPLVQEDGAAVLIIGSRATPAAILILLGLLLPSSSALAQTTTAQ